MQAQAPHARTLSVFADAAHRSHLLSVGLA
jgi:hypothetical protein